MQSLGGGEGYVGAPHEDGGLRRYRFTVLEYFHGRGKVHGYAGCADEIGLKTG